MNDHELMEAVTLTASRARRHYCTGCDPYGSQLSGTVPAQWMPKARLLAAREGYSLSDRVCPDVETQRGACGHTAGRIPPGSHAPRTICLKAEMSEQDRYATTLHELTHVLLRHPPDSFAQAQARYYRAYHLPNGTIEDFDQEVPACLSAAAAGMATGMTLGSRLPCYLSQRLSLGAQITGEHHMAAFCAARELARAFR
jgi:hypothetical protein